MNNIENIFTDIYDKNMWHMGQNETRSGLGSTTNWASNIRNNIINLIDTLHIKNILDVSCGEWNWMKENSFKFKDDIYYTGLDIVKDVIDNNIKKYSNNNINFIHTDMLTYLKSIPNKSVDLLLCRHTFEHLPTSYNIECLIEIKRICKYALITTNKTCNNNIDLDYSTSVYRPINLDLQPYNTILNFTKEYYYDAPINTNYNETFIILYRYNN